MVANNKAWEIDNNTNTGESVRKIVEKTTWTGFLL